MARVDPTARIADSARLAADAEVGPYCIVGGNVELRAGVRLHSHINIQGVTIIGERTEIYPFASLGTPPQSNAYRGGATRLVVGSECRIREGVTMSTGSEDGGGVTAVGSGCFFMANSHVGHDCQVGDHVTFANNAVLGGHVSVADHVFVGGNTAVHQFVRIGEGAMLGGMSGVTRDVIPFGFAFGPKADLVGINVVGLRRRGLARTDIHRIRRAYRALFEAGGTFAERLAAVTAEYGGEPAVVKILSFIRDGGPRPLMMAAGPAADSGDPP